MQKHAQKPPSKICSVSRALDLVLKTYKLKFNEVQLGSIEQHDADFPNLFGSISFSNFILPEHLQTHMEKYIKFCINQDQLLQEDREDEIDYSKDEVFTDLIESEKWFLVSEDGEQHKILIPLFGVNDTVVWRWSI